MEEVQAQANKIVEIRLSHIPGITADDLQRFFAQVEMSLDGETGTASAFDFVGEATVRLELPLGRAVDAIILQSPDCSGLTYRVLVS